MAGLALEKGQTIYKFGQPVTALHLIAKGKVKASYPGGSFELGAGGVIGICEICSDIHFIEYTATEETSVVTYSISNPTVLDDLLEKHPDVAKLFLVSAFHQISTMMEQCSVIALDCSSLRQNLNEDYIKYLNLCDRYRVPPCLLEGINEVTTYFSEDASDFWLSGFYQSLARLYTGKYSSIVADDPALSSGFLRKCSLDSRRTYFGLDEQAGYRDQVFHYYFNDSGNDLFDLFTSLYYKLGSEGEDSEGLRQDIERMIQLYHSTPASASPIHDQRISSYQSTISRLKQAGTGQAENSRGQSLKEIAGSTAKILEFAGADRDGITTLKQDIQRYKLLNDRNSTNDDVIKLRTKLTKEFYQLYLYIFERTLTKEEIPTVVWMFLYFGYIDEDLAGTENALLLLKFAQVLGQQPSAGVYTMYDWLMAIYKGEKMPSRDEFEQDFTDYIHKQKSNGEITDKEARALEKDGMAKVQYELFNMIPSANKMTYGRITTFCPFFTAENMLKKPADSLVTVSKVTKILQTIKQWDYSAFYREILDTRHQDILGRERVHVEQLPDIILMPNAGIRGVMWQEIEGKVRNTPCRMVISIFHMEDLTTSILRLTGEFRWEMCKRIQGARWNDVTDKSLTSEYFDYIQFYRKNQELSSEAKEKLQLAMQRAKNSIKEMFVRDYIVWVMFEGNGTPRLNKVARRILFSYCPFPAPILKNLENNPLYSEPLSRHKIKTAQTLHHLERLQKKIQHLGKPVPDILQSEIAFVSGTI